jgi:biofilm PGA synthesis N-glycosyltransferase PgaC
MSPDDVLTRVAPAGKASDAHTRVASAFPPPQRDSSDRARGGRYFAVPVKYAISIAIGLAWTALSVLLSLRWLDALSGVVGSVLALVIITFIAYVPGFMNAFLVSTILLDRRPRRRTPATYPPVSILVACYNEQAAIADTILSLARQDYPGPMEVLILDDGSVDETVARAQAAISRLSLPGHSSVRVVSGFPNMGKSAALNRGLELCRHEIVLTIDGDSWVYADAVTHIVERYLADPPQTRAVAGCVLARNSRKNWVTQMQEWDYFHGIAAVKRMQSMYHGTLVAQGAFSLYDKAALQAVGGWPECVGEDIVVSWALLERGYRIGYCEDAVAFTNVPDTLRQFARQRQRWSRGLLEAFKAHPRLLLKARMSTLFVWWNVFFLPLDLVYTFAFLPGLLLALLGMFYIAGPMTLLVLPLAILWNLVIFSVQRQMFKRQDLVVRRNVKGFLLYVFVYTMILQPVCVWGYASELFGLRKRWGTK